MLITRRELRGWRVSPDIYRWFLRRFPSGGRYADVHSQLIQSGRVDWATSLVEYAYSLWLEKEGFVRQETRATDLLAFDLNQSSVSVHISLSTHRSDYSQKTASDVDGYRWMDVDSASQVGSAGDSARLGSCGGSVRIACSGVNAHIGSTGEYGWLSSSGYASQIASAGYAARIGCVGHDVRIGSSGERARVASAGNSAKISSTGRGVRIASAGMRARIGSAGESAKVANAGDLSHISSFSEQSAIANVGDGARLVAMGKGSQVVSTASVDYVVLGEGGSAALSYFDGERMRFAVAYEGENGIRAGVKYRLNERHEFVELHP
ncbi:Uncharacterised protein [Leminorella richardii]|uniref:Uncharacterized protein n=1 Tax=Leminorella richardii TaxID=158841 RepID=A0A2X4UUC1_9GAMM|nr:hypothetical protein [Leminorella richardii]SQI42401.1 Uncharacterised protein [Leminorella richardii]